MSTSDQQGNQPLTRKQLREIRLTGATPVITEEEAAAAAATPPPSPSEQPSAAPAEPASAPRSDADVDLDGMPLTRRQVREQERIRTASVPVVDFEGGPADDVAPEDEAPAVEAPVDAAPVDEAPSAEAPDDETLDETPRQDGREDEIVAGIPEFTSAVPAEESADLADDDSEDAVVDVEPVSAAAASEATSVVLTDVDPTAEAVDDADADDSDDAQADDEISVPGIAAENHDDEDDDSPTDEDPITTGERPVVNSMFGKGLLDDSADVPAFTPSFDELITSDSGGSQHLAPNTLIFTPSSREGSLSGPVASTGELLITGSYDLPRGIGSQGHAHGTTDGREADAVLIDGELPPSSSPTPIAASSAISTTKPAGEVIRPPAPEKGNKLMLTLAITAGGLALALAAVLIVAFMTNVL